MSGNHSIHPLSTPAAAASSTIDSQIGTQPPSATLPEPSSATIKFGSSNSKNVVYTSIPETSNEQSHSSDKNDDMETSASHGANNKKKRATAPTPPASRKASGQA